MRSSSQITTTSKSIDVQDSLRSLQVKIENLPADALVEKIKGYEETGGNIAVIVNTVNSANKLYQILQANFRGKVTLAHSRFVAVDRLNNDAKLIAQFGSNTKFDNNLHIVVGTQILEQSLDIDFDIMFSELAPMDSLLQRMGRLHRHAQKNPTRPEQFAVPIFAILEPDEVIIKSIGSKIIYSSYRLEQTKKIIKHLNEPVIFSLPQDIASLIESAHTYYDSDLEEEKQKYDQKKAKRKNDTKGYMIASPVPERNKPIFGWLKGGVDTELSGESRVRDGVSGPTVIAVFTDSDGKLYVPYYNDKGERLKQFLTYPDTAPYWEALVILGSTLSLPMTFNEKIAEIEASMSESELRDSWKNSSLLSGEIAIIFDVENKSTLVENSPITYSTDEGLTNLNANH